MAVIDAFQDASVAAGKKGNPGLISGGRALHITQTIRDNAVGALTALEQIRLQVGRILARERTNVAAQADRVGLGVRSDRKSTRLNSSHRL